jgi:hypothetical protein
MREMGRERWLHRLVDYIDKVLGTGRSGKSYLSQELKIEERLTQRGEERKHIARHKARPQNPLHQRQNLKHLLDALGAIMST